MAQVFLSYDPDDALLAKPLVQLLEKAGHTVWFDRHIHGGAQYSRKIEQALDEADAVMVLWSPRSLESAWVRDEAAEGRDRGKLVPISVGGVSPPMGFRQYQTIDLGEWTGRGRVPASRELLEAVESQAALARPAGQPRASPMPTDRRSGLARPWLVPAAILLLLAIIGGGWAWFGRGGLPVVEVAAANSSPRSQAAASDLFVKLGSLAAVGEGKWQLVDASSAPAKPDLVFRTADTGSAGGPTANLVLLDGKNDSLLWSREFSFPAGREADLRQQLSLTAGRVLGCALETRDAGGLPRNLFKLFLNACASLAENSYDELSKVAGPLRTIVRTHPKFEPACGRLIHTDLNQLDIAMTGADLPGAVRKLRADMENARKVAPDLPALAIADVVLLPDNAYAKKLELLARAVEKSPDYAQLLTEQSQALQGVGRMSDAVQSARRAAELDPLSPAATTQYLMTLAYAGQIESARKELEQAQRLWAGTGALRDAEWGFYLRFGDPAFAKRIAAFHNPVIDSYLDAREDASPANVRKLLDSIRRYRLANGGAPYDGWLLQTFAEFAPVDEALQLIEAAPAEAVARDSYVLFRPVMANVRRDPRFMGVAKRIGLLDYWRSTGKWPDFCSEPDLSYDCKTEAAKYG